MAPRDGAAENAVPLHARLARSSCASHPPRPRPLASTRCVLARPAPARPAPPAPRLRARGCAAPRYMLPLWQRGSHLWWRSHGARWRPFLSNNGHLGRVLQSPTGRSRKWIRIWIRFGRMGGSPHGKSNWAKRAKRMPMCLRNEVTLAATRARSLKSRRSCLQLGQPRAHPHCEAFRARPARLPPGPSRYLRATRLRPARCAPSQPRCTACKRAASVRGRGPRVRKCGA